MDDAKIALVKALIANGQDRLLNVSDLVTDEAYNATLKHKPMNSHHEAKAVIEEEFDEYWELVKLNPKKPMFHPTKGHALSIEQWKGELKTELVQTAAMCLRALHDLC